MLKSLFDWIKKYERHLSAAAMLAGFVADNIFFTRVDVAKTQVLLAIYTIACFVSIPALHALESRKSAAAKLPSIRLIFPLITQFALGGFWSAFVIFYGRSAVFGASWPFLLFLFLVFLGSEYFHHYHERLVFTSVLFFFALYSTAIFEVPIYTHAIDTPTFLLSGAVAIGAFALFTILLRFVAHERFRSDVWRIRVGAFGVLLAMNLFYFTNILPPLPLSATAGGVYHDVWHVPGAYMGTSESESWLVRYLGFTPTLHIVAGDAVYAYSAVFAPTALTTSISHEWQWYDPIAKAWVPKAVITYDIVGGRDGGYRGYSQVAITSAGAWRVNIKSADGRLIDQLPFMVEFVASEPATSVETLK